MREGDVMLKRETSKKKDLKRSNVKGAQGDHRCFFKCKKRKLGTKHRERAGGTKELIPCQGNYRAVRS